MSTALFILGLMLGIYMLGHSSGEKAAYRNLAPFVAEDISGSPYASVPRHYKAWNYFRLFHDPEDYKA